MSEIFILGFLPDSESTTPLPIHWSILISPVKGTDTCSESQPQPKSKPRLFRHNNSSHKQSPTDTALFDMHDHQLRQQPFPVPSPASSSTDLDTSSETATTTAATTSITSSIPNHPLRLAIRIALATHHSPPSKLAPKLSTILYQTPTYGPSDDWLRAALEQLISADILESDADIYKASSILDFIHASTAQHAQDLSSSSGRVVDFDYSAQLSRTAQVKAMFNQPRTSSRTPSPSVSSTIKDEKAKDKDKAKKRFLGFWLTHGSGGHDHHPQRRCAYQPHPWQRQDDPYGGLM